MVCGEPACGIKALVAGFRYLQVPGAYPPAIFISGGCFVAREESIFADESGDVGGVARYYLLTLVFHDQADDIRNQVMHYEQSLARADLPNIPFHSEPLLNGHGPYEGLDPSQRKHLLWSFNVFVQRLPISYVTFVYRRNKYPDPEALSVRMERDLVAFMANHLPLFQVFDDVKVYYDNGQAIVERALYGALGSALSSNVVVRRKTTMTDYRLEQVADYLCTIELAAVKYAAHEDGETYNKFFGGVGAFKKNWLKQARRKRID